MKGQMTQDVAVSQEFQREDCGLAWKGPGKGKLSANTATPLGGCLLLLGAAAALCLCVSEHLEEQGAPQLLSFLVLRQDRPGTSQSPFQVPCVAQVGIPGPIS